MTLTAVSSTLRQAGYQVPDTLAKTAETAPVAAQATAENSGLLNADILTLSGRLVGHAAGGGFATYKLGGQMAQQMKEVYQNFKTGGPAGTQGAFNSMRQVATTGLRGAGLSAIVSAGSSIVANGLGVVKDKIDTQTAVSNVISDTLSGAVGGLSAVTLGGAGHLALSSFGVVGLPLTIATVAIGAAGGTLAGHLVHQARQPQKQEVVQN